MPTNLTEAKWVKAADLLPGTPSMVRRASISVENGPVLAVWEPGDDAVAGARRHGVPAFRPDANLRLQIYYKKPWQDEQQAKSDRSTIGLYFTDEPLSGKDIQAFTVDGRRAKATRSSRARSPAPCRRPDGCSRCGRRSISRTHRWKSTAVAASGRRVPLLKLRGAAAGMAAPLLAGRSGRTAGRNEDRGQGDAGRSRSGPFMKPLNFPLQIALDFVPQ